MITFDNVSKRYPGGHQALNQVSFELEDGEMAFLTGRSGAGTLGRTRAGGSVTDGATRSRQSAA